MAKIFIAVAFLLNTSFSWGAVVVLKGGKKLEVVSYEKKGNYLVAVQANGRRVTYPMSAVDVEATNRANAVSAEVVPPEKPQAPKSPFAPAVAKPGEAVTSITDADVQKVAPAAGAGEEEQAEEKPREEGGVVVLGWFSRELEEGQQEVVVQLANQNRVPVQDVMVSVRAMGPEGKVVGTGSGTYPGRVLPGQEFTVPVRIPAPVAPDKVLFSVTWKQLSASPEAQPPAPGAPRSQPVETPPPSELGPGE
ncbi:MAG: hypothetical protein ACUVRY_07380 [Thermoanaerobaculaceae bacterium]